MNEADGEVAFKGVPTSCTSYATTDMSFSDFYASDLSDITSSSEDEYTSTTVKRSSAKKSKRDQTSAYTIVNTLRPPRSTSYSVRALYGLSYVLYFHYSLLTLLSEQIVDGSINLDPAYQRGTLVSHLVHQSRDLSVLHRYCLARTKADWPYRLGLSQLLHSAYHLWSANHFPLFPLRLTQTLLKAVSTSDDGSETRVCIDGKQRLTSIQK